MEKHSACKRELSSCELRNPFDNDIVKTHLNTTKITSSADARKKMPTSWAVLKVLPILVPVPKPQDANPMLNLNSEINGYGCV